MPVWDTVEAFVNQFIPVKYRAKNISGQIVLLTVRVDGPINHSVRLAFRAAVAYAVAALG